MARFGPDKHSIPADATEFPLTDSDRAVLHVLYETGVDLPPTPISMNLDGIHRRTVFRSLNRLLRYDLVERTDADRGYYGITDDGRALVGGEE